MQSSTYGDLIDGKLAQWQTDIAKLTEHAQKSASEHFSEKVNQLKAAISVAAQQLEELDKGESVANTMETKGEILKIFDSIDREFKSHSETTPYML